LGQAADPFAGIRNARAALIVVVGAGLASSANRPGVDNTRESLLQRRFHDMSTLHFHQTTTATPEQFVAGLTDFGPGRSKLFPNSADRYLKVHHQGPHEADVTEGSGGVWERLHYDWSDPNCVKLTTIDSNMFGGASGYTYTFRRQLNRTTDVDVVIVREGKNFKGRVLSGLLGTVAMRSLRNAFVHSVKAIESRSNASVAEPS
jgi:hypothetical protein